MPLGLEVGVVRIVDWIVLHKDIFFFSGKTCQKLERLDLSGVSVTEISLKMLSEGCGKLKVSGIIGSISFSDVLFASQEDIPRDMALLLVSISTYMCICKTLTCNSC